MTEFEPSRPEFIFRLTVSVFAFFSLGGALALRGLPAQSPWAEGSIIVLIFLGISAIESLRRLQGPDVNN